MTRRGGWAPASRPPAVGVAVTVAVALAVAGCGGSNATSADQLRSQAAHACTAAKRKLDRIPPPTVPSDGAMFLRRGIAGLSPEVTALTRLHPAGELQPAFSRARTAIEQELKALQSALKGLKAGNDAVVAIKTLQAQLVPLEKRARTAWMELKIPACADA